MPLIVDGYNLLFRIQEKVDPLQESRQEVIDYIDSVTKNLTLLFDSNPEHAELYPQTKHLSNISIEFAPLGLSADEYIIEKLRWAKHPAEFIIITSDKKLAREIRDLGGRTQSIDSFLNSLTKKKRKEKKELRDTPQEFKRLLKIFESNDEG